MAAFVFLISGGLDMTNYEMINLSLVALTLFVLAGQLRALKKTYLADHERRKKQETIEYLNRFRGAYKPIEEELFAGRIDLKALADHDAVAIRHILSKVEHLAVGIDTGIYDFELVNRMSGAFLVHMYSKFKTYIEQTRDARGNQNIYCEFDKLQKRISDARSVSHAGNMQHI